MYLCVDVGGTKTLVATFSDQGELLEKQKFPTSHDYNKFLDDFEHAVGLLEVKELEGAGVAVPGKVDRQNGIGIVFGNLPWENVPLKSDVEKIIACPVTIENDAKVGGLSEAKNVINDFKRVLYITIGTGIGFAFLVNDVNDLRVDDRGGKSYMVEHEGKQVPWESFASGTAIKNKYGKIAGEISDASSWENIVQNFAVGLGPLIERYSPDVVIIGGGVGAHFDKFGDLLKQALAKAVAPIPAIIAAKHPEEAVLYGCYELAKNSHG